MRRGRELPALGLALVWLFGVVVAPVLHLAMHASLAPHSHSVAETAIEESCHDGHCHDDDASEDGSLDGDARSKDAPADHGRGSPLHGDVAALFPAPVLVVPPFVAMAERSMPPCSDDVVDALPAPPSLARGPPTHA